MKDKLVKKFNCYSVEELKLRLNSNSWKFFEEVLSFTAGIISIWSIMMTSEMSALSNSLNTSEAIKTMLNINNQLYLILFITIVVIFAVAAFIMAYLSYRRSIMFIVFRKKTTDIKN